MANEKDPAQVAAAIRRSVGVTTRGSGRVRFCRAREMPGFHGRRGHMTSGRRSAKVRTAAGWVMLAVLAVGLATGPASARSGVLGLRPDPGFGGGRGWVTTSLAGVSAVGYGVAIEPGGGIVVAGGTSTPTGAGQILVVRYLPNGDLDRSFGSGGIFTTALPAADGPFLATSVVVQRSTGKVLVAGGYGLGSMLALRLTPNGKLDRSFGPHGAGLATVAVGGIAGSLAVQRDGGILLGGADSNVNGRPMVVARLSAHGILDRRFGHGGIAQLRFWNPALAAGTPVVGLASTPDGGVIGFGHIDYIGSDGHGSAGVFRLSSRGQMVPAFGSGGHVEIAFKQTATRFAFWFPCAMTVGARGRITLAGDGSAQSGPALLSARLTSRGLADRSYGTNGTGLAVTPGLPGDADPTCGATSSATGELTVGVGPSLAGLQADGTPDDRFAPGGIFRIADPREVMINAVAGPGSRAIVVAGAAGNAMYVACYLLSSPRRR
jgi:uncharacterized delta-60 repeat protein